MELIRDYTIEDIARFRALRKNFTMGSRSIRVLSNHSIQFLEWCIAGHLYNLGIDDIDIQESYFDDFYTYSRKKKKLTPKFPLFAMVLLIMDMEFALKMVGKLKVLMTCK